MERRRGNIWATEDEGQSPRMKLVVTMIEVRSADQAEQELATRLGEEQVSPSIENDEFETGETIGHAYFCRARIHRLGIPGPHTRKESGYGFCTVW